LILLFFVSCAALFELGAFTLSPVHAFMYQSVMLFGHPGRTSPIQIYQQPCLTSSIESWIPTRKIHQPRSRPPRNPILESDEQKSTVPQKYAVPHQIRFVGQGLNFWLTAGHAAPCCAMCFACFHCTLLGIMHTASL